MKNFETEQAERDWKNGQMRATPPKEEREAVSPSPNRKGRNKPSELVFGGQKTREGKAYSLYEFQSAIGLFKRTNGFVLRSGKRLEDDGKCIPQWDGERRLLRNSSTLRAKPEKNLRWRYQRWVLEGFDAPERQTSRVLPPILHSLYSLGDKSTRRWEEQARGQTQISKRLHFELVWKNPRRNKSIGCVRTQIETKIN